mgnify:CR=1 FL=1
MLICRPTSTSLGERIHMEQSLVGKVLSSLAITPPMAGDFSTRCTKKPEFARSKAACMPAIPPPTIATDPLTGGEGIVSCMGFSFFIISFDRWVHLNSLVIKN